jgi:hypothetical protein
MMTAADDTPRPGTGVDLSRRMDRMEQRQDKMEASLNELQVVTARVESNQKHADEIAGLRHDALKTGLDALGNTVGIFITRIEGIIDGSIQTTQTRQAQEIMAAYVQFRDKTLERLDNVEDHGNVALQAQATAAAALVKATAIETAAQLQSARAGGILSVLSTGQKFILLLAALASPALLIWRAVNP